MPVRTRDLLKGENEREVEFIKREFEFRRGISPFVCSTGEDFQVEHHLLNTKVFPELQRICQERGTFFNPCELQWTKSHPKTQKGHMLTSAFNFIERCAPFFLGLIGERYGYHRDQDKSLLSIKDGASDWIDTNLLVAAQSGYDWVLGKNVQYKSMTELQILYAGFKNSERRHLVHEESENQCFFYYRQPEHKDFLYNDYSPSERVEKLKLFEPENDYCNFNCRRLKGDVIKKGHTVRYFQRTEELCSWVLADWKAVIDEFCPPIYEALNITTEKEKDLYVDWLQHESLAEHKRDSFQWLPEYDHLSATLTTWALTALDDPPPGWDAPTSNSDAVKAIKEGQREYPEAKYQSIIGIVGDRGSGKSSFIAQWVREFRQQYGFLNVFTHHVESSATSADVVAMLKRCIAYFSNQLQNNYETIDARWLREGNVLSTGEVFSASVSHKPCLIILDGLDDLGKTNNDAQVRDLSWLLYPLPPHVRMIVTTCRSDISYTALSKRPDTRLMPMPLLSSVTSQKTVLCHHMRGVAGRVNQQQVHFLLQHCKLADRPLFLQLCAAEALHYDVFTDFERYVESVLEKCSVRDLLNMLVLRWIDSFSWPAVTTQTPKSSRGTKQPDPNKEAGGWVADILRLLVVSRHGLNLADIMDLLDQLGYHGDTRVTQYDVMLFLDVILDVIVYEAPDGLLRFNHQHIKEGVEHTLLSPLTIDTSKDLNSSSVVVPRKGASIRQNSKQLDKKIYHTYLADHFAGKSHSDRRTRELVWQLAGSKDKRRLHHALSEPRLFMDLMSALPTRAELCEMWESLMEDGHDPASSYTDMMALLIHDAEVPDITVTSDGQLSPVLASTARDDTALLPPLTPRVDVYELGKYTGQFLLLFHHPEAALQISLSAYNQLTQICPLEHEQEQMKCELEAQVGASYHALHMRKDAVRWYDRALGTVTDMLAMIMLPRQKRTLTRLKGNVLIELATVHLQGHQYILAEELLSQARKCVTLSDNLIGGARIFLKLGLLKSDQRDFYKAHAFLQRAQTEYEKWFGKNHHQVSDALHEFARLLSNDKNTFRMDEEKAETLFRRALKLREQAYGKNHLKVADTLFYLGQLLKTYKQTLAKNEALRFLQRAYDIHSTKLGPEHSTTKKMYKAMNDLEIAIKFKPQYHVENRIKELPFSTLSWHESELNDLEMRARRKAAVQNVCTLRVSMKALRAFKGLKLQARKRSEQQLAVPTVPDDIVIGQGGKLEIKEEEEEESGQKLVRALGVLIPAKDGAAHVKSFVSESSIVSEHASGLGDSREELHTIQEIDTIGDDISLPGDTDVDEEESIMAQPLHSQSETIMTPRENNQVSPRATRSATTMRHSLPRTAPNGDTVYIPTGRPISRSDARSMDTAPEYLDSFSMISSSKVITPRGDTAQKKVLRPQSAPYKMLQKYQNVSNQASRASSVIPRTKHRRISSAPPVQRGRFNSSARPGGHRSKCPEHTPHAFSAENTYSAINGPNASTDSLLGPKACPRDTEFRLQHTSAWYHVPGRYATMERPYPPKRSQARIQDAHRKLVTNLHTKPGHSKLLLSSTFPTYIGARPTYLNPSH